MAMQVSLDWCKLPDFTRRCQSNESNTESIERNRTQSNNCDSIVERNRIAIEYYPEFAVRLLRLRSIVFDCVRLIQLHSILFILMRLLTQSAVHAKKSFKGVIKFNLIAIKLIENNHNRRSIEGNLQSIEPIKYRLTINWTNRTLLERNRTQLNITQEWAVRLRFDCVRQSNRNHSIAFDCVRLVRLRFPFEVVRLTPSGLHGKFYSPRAFSLGTRNTNANYPCLNFSIYLQN